MKLVILQTEWSSSEQEKIKDLLKADSQTENSFSSLEKTDLLVLDTLSSIWSLEEPFLLFSSNPDCYQFSTKHHIPFLGMGLSLNCPYLVDDLEALDDFYIHLAYSRFYKLPLTICKFEDFVLREYTFQDFFAVQELYRCFQNNESVEAFPEEESAALELFSSRMTEYRYCNHGFWGIFHKGKNLIGQIGISSYENGLELSYLLHPDFQGKGIAFELCKLVLSYVKEELGILHLTVRIHPFNKASIKLAQKLKETYIMDIQIIPF